MLPEAQGGETGRRNGVSAGRRAGETGRRIGVSAGRRAGETGRRIGVSADRRAGKTNRRIKLCLFDRSSFLALRSQSVIVLGLSRVARFLDMPRRIAQERVPTAPNVGSRKCDVGLPAHTSHPLSRLFACFAGPIP
jgi:hypothetical protein